MSEDTIGTMAVSVTVNGHVYTGECEPRLTLADFLRHRCGLTGTHLGCEHGVCGACTILVDGRSARACLMLAVQADGATITTVEGLSGGGELNSLQEAFWDNHGLQCGFCTPGMLMTATELLDENPEPDAAGPRVPLGQPLPVYRIRRDRHLGAGRGAADARLSPGSGSPCGGVDAS